MRFNQLTVLGSEMVNKRLHFQCRCDCGTECLLRADHVKSGHTQKCRSAVHIVSRIPENNTFKKAKQRCQCKTDAAYPAYGGRGIEFRYISLAEFIADVGPKPSAAHSIDRIDNDSHYMPGNCRWATKAQQAQNRRRGRISSTGYLGVHRQKPTSKNVVAVIGHNCKALYLGSFTSVEEAALVYDAAAIRLRGPDVRLNFPPKKPSLSVGTKALSVAA